MKILTKLFFVFFTLLVLVWSCSDDDSFWDAMIPETDKDPTTTQINGYVFKPALVPATDENVQQLKVPTGFKVNKFAENLG